MQIYTHICLINTCVDGPNHQLIHPLNEGESI